MLITSVGGLLIDLMFNVPRWPESGLSVNATEYRTEPGGKGLIQAVTLSRLGVRAAILSRIGDDDFSKIIKRVLDFEQVDRRFLISNTEFQTGIVCVIYDGRKEEGYIGAREATTQLTMEHILDAEELFIHSSGLIVNLDVGVETASTVLNKSFELNPNTIRFFNATPPELLNTKEVKDLAAMTDYFLANGIEASVLLGINKKQIPAKELALRVLESGFKNVLITEGFDGGYFASQQDQFEFKPVPMRSEDILEFRGAKDVFCASLLYMLCKGTSLRDSIYFASVASSKMLLTVSAIQGIPTIHSIQASVLKNQQMGLNIFES